MSESILIAGMLLVSVLMKLWLHLFGVEITRLTKTVATSHTVSVKPNNK